MNVDFHQVINALFVEFEDIGLKIVKKIHNHLKEEDEKVLL